MNAAPEVVAHFDEATHTVSYIVWDKTTSRAAIIDSVLDFDQASGRVTTKSADALLADVAARGLSVDWILDTHVHADHLSAAAYLKGKLDARICIGSNVGKVQGTFRTVFNIDDVSGKGTEFDCLLTDSEKLPLGNLRIETLDTPGHTPACVSYLIGDAVFVGDTLFMPDYGSARCDFPGGDARTLYRSIQRLFALPASTRMFLCHDYKAPGRDTFVWETTIGEQRAKNVHLHDGIDEETFVKMRSERDAKLLTPALLLPSVQVNIRAGNLPPPEANGTRYLKVPVITAKLS
jgi:glyoxylase-like metal-dependent hydrolase (beta-lactamase superfamily II)